MGWCDELKQRWVQEGLFEEGQQADVSSIRAFESREGVALPEEFRVYFQSVNGMNPSSGRDVDSNGFAFWPLNSVHRLDRYEAANAWRSVDELRGRSACVFSDYLQVTCAFAFKIGTNSAGSIYMIGLPKPKLVARSLREFVDLYLHDDPKLYP